MNKEWKQRVKVRSESQRSMFKRKYQIMQSALNLMKIIKTNNRTHMLKMTNLSRTREQQLQIPQAIS